jgi:hypothetical protein
MGQVLEFERECHRLDRPQAVDSVAKMLEIFTRH